MHPAETSSRPRIAPIRTFGEGFIQLAFRICAPFWAERLTGGLTAGLAGGLAEGTCALTLLPSCSLSTPVMTTTSPGASPEVTSESSPSVVPITIGRTVTDESAFTTYT